jgi:multicomponent K+:H+ antiporter subunit G
VTALADAVVALLLLCSGGLAFTAALGLVRLPDFFLRLHAPSLASTLATWIATLASVLYFATRPEPVPSAHLWIIIVVLAITTPVTTIVLARAALFRDRLSGAPLPPPLPPSREPR